MFYSAIGGYRLRNGAGVLAINPIRPCKLLSAKIPMICWSGFEAFAVIPRPGDSGYAEGN